ncbi:MAG: rRNA maturation RNase YbeY [Spirochaetota bacterium]|nr:rRNA maturation RNase YbeY [Spirochaetota bacterium]
MRVEIFQEGKVSLLANKLKERDVKYILKRICKELNISNIDLTLIITDNNYIQGINSEYRNEDKPTDVITFVYNDPPFPEIGLKDRYIGDIFLSLEMAEQQAEEYNVNLEDELKRLLVHGILHLVGYDHETSKEDERKMREREEAILDII